MMKGISFDNIHSFTDLNLVLSNVNIPPATPKTNYIDIPGGDGSVDLTEALGDVKYKNRECSFTFTIFPYEDAEEKKTKISNLLNGKRCKIKLDKDSGYYWDGRCSVNSYASQKNIHQIVIGASVAPYKLKNDVTRVFVPFCGKNLLDVSESNQINQLYGSVEYMENGFRKSGKYFVGFRAYVQKNTQYFISCDIAKIVQASLPGNGGRMAVYDTTNTKSIAHFSSSEGYSRFTFNSGDYTEINVLFYSDSDSDQGVYEFTNIQLESEQITEFEPYNPIETKEITLINGRKKVVPTIICTNETTLSFDGTEVILNAGTHRIPDFQLQEGETPVTVHGTGAVNIEYQEGEL